MRCGGMGPEKEPIDVHADSSSERIDDRQTFDTPAGLVDAGAGKGAIDGHAASYSLKILDSIEDFQGIFWTWTLDRYPLRNVFVRESGGADDPASDCRSRDAGGTSRRRVLSSALQCTIVRFNRRRQSETTQPGRPNIRLSGGSTGPGERRTGVAEHCE